MKYLVVCFLLFHLTVFSQSRLEKWGKGEVNYTIPVEEHAGSHSVEADNIGEALSGGFIFTYRVLFSDVDGDNCPFYPSCSGFFIQSVKETNLIQGTLMFADRFTRDINFINRRGKYKIHKTGKYFDPVFLYSSFNSELIISQEANSRNSDD